MQNIAFREAGIYDGYEIRPDGSILRHNLTPSSARKIFRTQSGYTGKRVQSSPMPVHGYSFQVVDVSLNQDYYEQRDSAGNMATSSGPCLSTDLINPGEIQWTTQDWNALDSRALDNLNDKVRGDLDLSVDLAESHQVLKMLNTTERLERYAQSFANKSKTLRTAKALANHWLEFVYGVKPLASSIYGAANEGIRLVLNKTERFTGRASAIQRSFAPYGLACVWGGSKYFTCSGGAVKHSVTYGVDLRTQDFDLARWTSLNPVSIAWELLPYSFVVDWVYNVGGYLRNLETSLLYASRFRSGYRTALSVGNVAIKHIESTGNSTSYVRQAYTGHYRVVSISRQVLSTYPIPNLPSLKVQMGSSRLLSAASLLSQFVSDEVSSPFGARLNAKRLNRRVQREQRRLANKPGQNVSVWPPGYIHL